MKARNTMTEDLASLPRRSRVPTLLLIGGLLLVFAVLSYSAALTKSPTSDEPVHLVASYVCRFLGDYRCNPEHPVLWKYWAAMFLTRDDIHINTTSALTMNRWGETIKTPWPAMLEHPSAQFDFSDDALYGPQHGNTDHAVAAARLAMLMAGLLLGAFIAAWAWRLGEETLGPTYGRTAAVIATALFAQDPNMMGHASLVTNDVVFTLCFALVAWSTWLVGRKLTLTRAATLGLACGVAINVKYSAVVCGPIVALLLLVRAVLGSGWPMAGRIVLKARITRLAAAVALGIFCAAVCVLVTWAAYGFRFAAGHDGEEFKSIEVLRGIRWRDHMIRPDQPLLLEQLPLRVRAVWWVEDHYLLPQGYTTGLLRFEKDAVRRTGYLCGQLRQHGWWYYYPAAMLFKTPLGALGLAALAGVAGMLLWKTSRGRQGDKETRRHGDEESADSVSPCLGVWSALCLLLPPAAYLGVGMASAFNIGLRHMFPVYPFVFICMALPLAWLWKRAWRWGRIVLLALLIATATEVAWGYPHYIAFFNQACGGWRNGGKYLVDSNLDWGQDLPLLAEWQIRQGNPRLYLLYCGQGDPGYYHISNVVGMLREYDLPLGVEFPRPVEPGWLVMSANFATGALLSPRERKYYRSLAELDKPDEILGGSFYLYRYPSPPRPNTAGDGL